MSEDRFFSALMGYLQRTGEDVRESRRELHKHCETNLERSLADGLLLARNLMGSELPTIVRPGFPIPNDHDGYFIAPQFRVRGYRVDFLLVARWYGCEALLAVEADGWAFHDRKPEQVARDAERDATLLAAGFQVFRCKERDINADPFACAAAAADRLFDIWTGFSPAEEASA